MFNVRVTAPVRCEAHVPHVNEARLPLWHAHLVRCDCSCAALAGRAAGEAHSDVKKEKKQLTRENIGSAEKPTARCNRS